jgi:amino acid adenylation domain-containing protein
VALESYSHQDLPFEKLVEELHPPRDPSRSPLFQALLSLLNTPEPAADLEGFRLEPLRIDNGTAHYDLEMSFEPLLGGGLGGIVTRNTDLFDAATADRLIAHFQTLLAGALERPERRISELPVLSAVERHRLLVEWGRGRMVDGAPRRAVLHGFEELAAARPDDPAVTAEGLALTRGELNRRANQLAHHLRRLGAGPERVVAVLLGRSPELAVSALGIWKAGAAYLPLDPAFPEERLATVLADSGARMVVTVGELASRVPAGWQVLALDSADLARESGNDLPPLADPANLAYAVYTSGSTGRPKGVAVSWSSLEGLVAWQHRVRPLQVGERVALLASPSFDVALWELGTYLAGGAEIRIPDEETRLSPRLLARWLTREGIASCFLPTPAAEAFVAEPESAGTALRHLYTGGDRLHRLARRDLTFTVDNLYGPSEATVLVSWAPAADRQDAGRDPSIGRPIDGVSIYLLDSGLRPVPSGAWGELFAAGRALARGYLGSPNLTAERFLPDPHGEPGSRMYRTGDRARFRPDGEIEVAGRLDHQVKVRGFRIELGEIEAALRAHPEVEQAVAAVRDEPARLAAWVVPRGRGGEDLPAVLREHLRRLLPEYMVPAAIAVLDKLPLTASGKLDRRALPALSLAAAPARDFVPPATEEERAIAAVWAEVLGVGRVGADDNFFDLGGHSMLLARVQTVLAERLGRELPLLKLIEHPTVRALAAFLAGGEGGPVSGESRERALRQRQGLELQRQRLAAARRSV